MICGYKKREVFASLFFYVSFEASVFKFNCLVSPTKTAIRAIQLQNRTIECIEIKEKYVYNRINIIFRKEAV